MNDSNFCNVVLPIIQTETINMKQPVMPKINYTYFRQHHLTRDNHKSLIKKQVTTISLVIVIITRYINKN